jgi:predicted SAM-dependent methyltransferase
MSIKLHLGCGKRYIPGFFHIDAFDDDHIDHVCSIDNLEFIESNSVDLIYASHVIEHFKRERLPLVLKEWNRILKKEGIIRLAVPNFEAICKIYLKNKSIDQIIGPLFGGQTYLYNIHYNTFDFNSISDFLHKASFKEVKLYDWKETEHANIDDFSQAYIPHMDKENGTLISLNVQAKKS